MKNQTILIRGKQLIINPNPITKKVYLELKPPSLNNNKGVIDRLKEALHKDFPNITVPLPLMDAIVRACHNSKWRVTVTVADTAPCHKIIAVEEGNQLDKHYGLAIDIGTTTVVVYLVDLASGDILGVESDYNQQVIHGEDILSRIHFASSPENLAQLTQAIVSTLNVLINSLCMDAGITNNHISGAVIGGNTTMIHLLLGLSPTHLCREPYLPTVNQPGFLQARELNIAINPFGIIYCIPSIGSYVGGDAVAGILVSEMHKRDTISIIVDIGTNGEILLGNNQWLVACAGAAGPALEGGVVSAGIRAEAGAIDSIQIGGRTRKVRYTTIGNEKPKGICGSGLVDAVAELFINRIIDSSGHFKDDSREFTVVKAEDTAHGQDIIITQIDIRNLLRTKAAVNASLEVLLESVGCSLADIQDFYAAGAFGNYINPESAIIIGLYPDMPREKIHLIGNSSVEGARAALLDKEKIKELEEIVKNITYFEIGTHGKFMSKFTAGLFMPHSNLDWYPTVKQKLKGN
ncbi:ASKHA domain-containing protein [Desulfitibacter alkalitolerans]|uniref:ASKHA domain-containing protein n=1 Tax=Desulfitibacter alkalitolerans TaxID=264641 RepID=UPI000484E970|nr:ASKHA domain-containing protein [Desulfitibacter alkalitolerans]